MAGAGVVVPSYPLPFVCRPRLPCIAFFGFGGVLDCAGGEKRSGGVLAGSGLLSVALSFGLRGGGGQEQAVLFILHKNRTTICAKHKNIEKGLTWAFGGGIISTTKQKNNNRQPSGTAAQTEGGSRDTEKAFGRGSSYPLNLDKKINRLL